MRMPHVFADVMDRKHAKVDKGLFWSWMCKHQNGTAKNVTTTKDTDKLEKTLSSSVQKYREQSSNRKPPALAGKGSGKSNSKGAKGNAKGTGRTT